MFPHLRKYSYYFFKHKKPILWGLLCLLMTNIFGSVKPMVMKYAIDDMENSIQWNKILYFALFIVALAIVQGVFRFYQRQKLIGASRQMEYDLRKDLFAHMQKLSLSYYDKSATGDLMTRATSDIEAVRMAYGPGIMYSVDTIILSAFALTMMLTISVKMTLTALAVFPFVSVTVYLVGKQTYKRHTKLQESYSELTAFAQENISGVRVVKAFALENQHASKFAEFSRSYFDKNMSLAKVQALFIPILYFLLGIGVTLVLLIGGGQVIREEMTLGGFAAFMAYLMMLAWPMIAVGWVVNIFQRGEASMARLEKILATPPNIVDSENPVQFNTLTPRIEIKNLNFNFDERGEVLHNLSLTVEPGESLGIVGTLGSGKSALVKLIPRLYQPPENSVFIGGVPVEQIELKSLRNGIAFVPQDAFLFSEKIWENIDFNDKGVTEELIAAAAAVELTGEVEEFPDKFDSVVGERGITLSGGQKQRVTIARALLKNAPILILDDCLTAVDASTEAKILHHLKGAFKGKTVIVVSHRIFALAELDRIIVLEEGRIAESGTHRELLAREGVYYRLYKKQLLEMELEGM